MNITTQIRKPENWQDFEKLCKKLWGEIWQCPDTIQLNGRSGQKQNGIDVYGIPKGKSAYYGIQCKAKDEYTEAKLTPSIIDEEIQKAKLFQPQLERMIFATTANKDVSIEEYVRKKNLDNKKEGLFEVYISSWEDIVDLMEAHIDTYNWYLNNCQYKDTSDVNISFINGTEQFVIQPQYIRTTTCTVLKKTPPIPDSLIKMGMTLQQWEVMQKSYQPDESLIKLINNIKDQSAFAYNNTKIDYRWCKLYFLVQNVGNTTLEDYKIYIRFANSQDVIDYYNGVHYENNRFISDAVKAQINSEINRRLTVFECSDGSIMFEPKSPLVQTDSTSFNFSIKPKDDIKEITLLWSFKSKNFHKEGQLKILVQPQYEDKEEIIKVEDDSLLQETKIFIEPKIL